MNRIHNVIWSTAKGAWVVVAEGSKSCSKSGAKAAKVAMAVLIFTPLGVMAGTLPQGGTITTGNGSIVNNGGNQLVINQNTDKLGINWQSFNVGTDGHVIFNQPGKDSIALNRVIGKDGSAILGKIDANGQVFLINPNGVIFGKDSQVNVGGMVASTLNISDDDFKNGNMKFNAGQTSGEVLNLGSLQAAEGGYVALLGKTVKNNGVIKANLGNASLAAGDAVTLDFSGDGLINVQVTKSAVKALVENKGMIAADGGSVLMSARASNALLDTVVNNEGIIQANTIDSREGKIFLDGGFEGGTVQVAGTLDASAPTTGNGGFIETSGASVKIDKAVKISTQAKNGQTGKWLIDPEDFNIEDDDGASTANSIGSSTLNNLLGSTNVEIQTVDYNAASETDDESGEVGSGSTTGADINVNGAISWNADTKLTLSAAGDINVNNSITMNGKNAGLEMNFGGEVNVQAGSKVNFNGANTTYSENGHSFELLRTVDDLKKLNGTVNSKYYALGNNINASATSTWNGGLGFESNGYMVGSTLNGLGHSITNLYINRTSDPSAAIGLLGEVKQSTIANLKLTGTVNGNSDTGLLAGRVLQSSIHNIQVEGAVSGENNIGGVIGSATNNRLIREIQSSATVDGSLKYSSMYGGMDTGGVIGDSYGNANISNLTYNGTLVKGNGMVGGVIGNSSHDVIDGASIGSYSFGTLITGNSHTGGGIGYVSDSKVTNVDVDGRVEGGFATGGAFGTVQDSSVDHIKSQASVSGYQQLGGLIGRATNSSIDAAYATGRVHGGQDINEWGETVDEIGGLIGYASESNIRNTLAVGNVDGYHAVGGLIGHSELTNVENSFSTSKVVGNDTVGGLVGSAEGGSFKNSYATGDIQVIDVQESGSLDVNAGGFVGKSDSVDYTHTYSTGAVNATPGGTIGGFAGASSNDTYDGAYWATDSSQQELSAGSAVGKTTEELKNASTYDSWGGLDTDGTLTSAEWRIYDGYSLPLLKFLMGDIEFDGADVEITFDGNTHTYQPSDLYAVKDVRDKDFYQLFMLDDIGVAGGGFGDARNAGVYSDNSLYGGQFGYNIINNGATLTINKADLTVGAVGLDKIYDGNSSLSLNWFGLSAGAVGAADVGFNYTNASFSDKNAGNGKAFEVTGIYLTGADAANFNVNTSAYGTATITKAELSISATGNNKIYDGTSNANVTFTDNRKGLDDINVSASSTFSDKNVGQGKVISVDDIQISGADAGNYTWNTATTTAANIDKYGINAVATAHDKVYDGNVRTSVDLDYSVFGDDDVTVTGTAFFYDKNAGLNKSFFVGWVGLTGADSQNYYLSNTYGSANITKAALNISAEASSKVYDGGASASISLNDDRVSGDNLVIGYADAEFADKNAGQGKTVNVNGLSVSGSDAQNYTWDSSTTASANIDKATLILSATGVNKIYNGNTDADVNITDNRIHGDDLSISASASFDDKNAGVGKVVTLDDIVITGADAQNYDVLAPASVTADIDKATLTISASGVDRTYNGSTDADVTLSDDRIAGDDLTFAYNAAFADKNAGAGKVVNVDGFVVSGDDAQNYDIQAPTTTIATINKADLHISASGVDKIYDGSAAAVVGLNDDRVLGDHLNLSFADARFIDKNAGTGKLVTATGMNVTGTDAQNYVWNNAATTTADIAKAALDISAVASGKTYDGNTNASVILSDNRINGDDLVINASSSFSDKNAGASKMVTVDGITLAGADASNYTFNTQTTTTANIDKANLIISVSGVDRVYDGSSKADVALTDNRVAGDDLAIDYSANFSDKNAGSNKQVTAGLSVTGNDADNYVWNETAMTTADIAKANLQISAVASGKTYDGKTDASVDLSDDRIAGDDLAIGGSAAFSDKNAGNGKVVTVNGITLAGTDADNYTFNTSTTAIADIAKANLNISALADSKVYDGSNSAAVSLRDDRVAGDVLEINADAHFGDKNAGIGKTVTVGGITLGGKDAANYNFNTSTTANADIAKASLVVSAGNASKVEGALDGNLNWSLTGGTLFGDDAITGTLGREAGETAGDYAINKGNLSAGANYDLSVVPGNFEITSRKPVVKPELEHTREIVASISTATKVKTEAVALDTSIGSASGTPGDYRLLNLGMKLPDDITTDESTSY